MLIELLYLFSFPNAMEDNRNDGSQHFIQPGQQFVKTAKTGGVSLNVHLAAPPTTTATQDGSHTPNTPEILNSIVNMQVAREAREASASGGPFGAEFARQCAIYSTPTPLDSASSEIEQDAGVAVSLRATNPEYNYLQVRTYYIILV